MGLNVGDSGMILIRRIKEGTTTTTTTTTTTMTSPGVGTTTTTTTTRTSQGSSRVDDGFIGDASTVPLKVRIEVVVVVVVVFALLRYAGNEGNSSRMKCSSRLIDVLVDIHMWCPPPPMAHGMYDDRWYTGHRCKRTSITHHISWAPTVQIDQKMESCSHAR